MPCKSSNGGVPGETCPNLSYRQWGFTSRQSTVSALIRVLDDWHRALDQGNEVCVVFFDVFKAFDTVPNLRLLQKMIEILFNKVDKKLPGR